MITINQLRYLLLPILFKATSSRSIRQLSFIVSPTHTRPAGSLSRLQQKNHEQHSSRQQKYSPQKRIPLTYNSRKRPYFTLRNPLNTDDATVSSDDDDDENDINGDEHDDDEGEECFTDADGPIPQLCYDPNSYTTLPLSSSSNEQQQQQQQQTQSPPPPPFSDEEVCVDTIHDPKNDEICLLLDTTPPLPSILLPPSTDDDPHTPPCTRGIILVDDFSPHHSHYISKKCLTAYNAGVVSVISPYVAGYLFHGTGRTSHLSRRSPDAHHPRELSTWLSNIPFEIVGIICESDSGAGTAEELGVGLGLYPDRHDGVNDARRDKWKMNEIVSRELGWRTVRQVLAREEGEVVEFWEEMTMARDDDDDGAKTTTTVVAKPVRGVASCDVWFCRSLPQLLEAFRSIKNSKVFGEIDGRTPEAVLLQDVANGVEYAVDVVSKAGEHKVAALWRYDKRFVNPEDAHIVTYLTELRDGDSVEGRLACEYAMGVLDALGVHWGMSHVQVMVNGEEETTLIEANMRQHNTDFAPLVQACVGYNALDMVLAAYLGDGDDFESGTSDLRLDWESVPDLPHCDEKFAGIVHLICHVEGVVERVKGLDEIERLESVRKIEIYPKFLEGHYVTKTKDSRSEAGWLHLMNEDEDQFRSDYERIVELMPNMFEVWNGMNGDHVQDDHEEVDIDMEAERIDEFL